MRLTIRQMTLGDLDQVVDLMKSDPLVAFEKWEIPLLPRTLERNPEFNLVAHIEGEDKVVGAAIASGSVRVYITHFMTHPDYRGSGIGRLLLISIEQAAARAGINRIILHALSPNTGARTFFSRIGFIELRDGIQVTFEKDLPLH